MYKPATIFAAFTTPPKLAVIKALLPGRTNVTALMFATALKQPIVSQTLMQLRRLGIVSYQSEGRCKYYQLQQPDQVRDLLAIAESLSEFPGQR